MIVAVFTNNDDYARALGLTQWDYGQELRIQGLNLPAAVEIHFSLRETGGEAVTRVGVTKDGITTVPIPDSVLEGEGAACDYHIYAWVYLSDTKSGETIKRIDMPVKARSKPEPFDTPEAEELFAEAIEAVNEAADRAEKAGAEAVKVGEEAKEAAVKAGEYLEAVQGLAEQVEINADSVAQDKQAVAGMVTQTQQAASEAALSEQAAKQSQAAAEQAQAGAEVAEDAARQYAAETEEDRQEVAEDKQAVTQMRKDVAANRQAVEDAIAGFDGKVQGAMGEISAAGKAQVAAVNTVGQTVVQAVETAKGEAVKAVETEGTEQVGIVAAEGAKQLGEIARVMATIPEDYTQLDQQVQDLDNGLNTKAPAIRMAKTVQNGEPTELEMPGDSGLQGLKVYGKSTQVTTTGANLFPILPENISTIGGLTSVINSDGSITINGTPTVQYANAVKATIALPPGTYYLSGGTNAVGKLFAQCVITDKDGNKSFTSNRSFEIKGDEQLIALNIHYPFADLQPVENYVIYPMLNKGETALPFEPYTGGIPAPNPNYPQEIESVGEEIEIEATGRNLIDYKTAVLGGPDSEKKPEFIENGYILGGEPSDRISTYRFNFVKEETYTITFNEKHIHGTEEAIVYLIGTKGMPDQYSIRSGKPFVSSHNYEYFAIYHNLLDDVEARPKSEIINVQLAKGSTIYDYEPYKSQSLSLPTPNGLPGIPVTSGGNYTDQNGQQWICDTVEWDRLTGQKEYVQRVENVDPKILKYATINESMPDYNSIDYYHAAYDNGPYIYRDIPIMCNKFKWGASGINTIISRTVIDSGWGGKSRIRFNVDKSVTKEKFEAEILPTLVIITQMKEPIRTPLTPEQLAALKQLHTFSPTSIISNDQGADMQVIYVADTKAYIDSKIDALSKTILDAVGGK